MTKSMTNISSRNVKNYKKPRLLSILGINKPLTKRQITIRFSKKKKRIQTPTKFFMHEYRISSKTISKPQEENDFVKQNSICDDWSSKKPYEGICPLISNDIKLLDPFVRDSTEDVPLKIKNKYKCYDFIKNKEGRTILKYWNKKYKKKYSGIISNVPFSIKWNILDLLCKNNIPFIIMLWYQHTKNKKHFQDLLEKYKFDELHITSSVSMKNGNTGVYSDTIRTPVWLINGKHLLNDKGKKLFSGRNLLRVRISNGEPKYY